MAYEGNILDLPLGTKGLVQLDNRAQHTPGELVIAKGLTFEDNSLRKEAGVLSYDTSGIAGAPAFAGTLAASDSWCGILAAFYGSGIAATANTAGATKLSGAGTTFTVATPAGGYAAGSLVIVSICAKSGSTSQRISSVADVQGNTYTAISDATTGIIADGLSTLGWYKLFYSVLTNPLAAADLLTVTLASDVAAVAVIANYTSSSAWSVGATASNRSLAAQTPVAIGPTSTLTQLPALLICGLGSYSQTDTPGASFTEKVERQGAVINTTTSINHRIDATTPTIVAMHDWHSDVEAAGAGTVSTTAGSTAVVGVGTGFTSYAPGDKLIVNGEIRVISTITDATHLATTEAWIQTNAGVAYTRRVGGRLVTATTSGNLFKDKPSSLTATNLDDTTLASGKSLVARPGKFVAAGKEAAANNRKLFYFNGQDRVQVLSGDGATTTNIATPPADWDVVSNPLKQPLNGTTHTVGLATRLVAWGNLNRPHTVYFSDPDNHEDFTTASAFQMTFASNIGDRVVCAVDYQGILVLWKYPRGIFYLDDSDTSTANWAIRTKSESIGCAPSPHAVLSVDDDVLFMDAQGQFHLLSAVDTFGGLRASNLSYGLGFANWLRTNLNLNRLDLVTSVWHAQKKVAYFGAPGVGSTIPNLMLKLDFSGVNAGKPVLFHVSERDTVDCVGLRQYSDTIIRPLIAEGGFVYLTEQGARDKNGQSYTAQFQTAHEDFSYAERTLRYKRKHFEHLELVMEPVASGTITAVVYVDGVARQTLTFDATQRQQRKKLNVGDGHTLSVRCTEATLDGDMNIIWMGVYFKVGNEDQSR